MSEGKFVWCDLMTTDLASATAFYTAVIGWTTADSGLTDRSYTVLHAGGAPIGGMMAWPQPALDAGARPAWTGYIGIADVDATAARVTAAGGTVHHGPDDIPGVGRFAAVADPQGAMFTLFRGTGEMLPAPSGFMPGRVGWHELYAADWEGAFAFYADMFGWTKADAIDMGPIGTYQLFATGDMPVGGMMTRMDKSRPPSWLYYFNVEEINAAVARINAAGGAVLHGPQQVPGGSWIVQARDPQGGLFAVVAPGSASNA
jgi:predicted enzyme related to lactoylglutathione lyase